MSCELSSITPNWYVHTCLTLTLHHTWLSQMDSRLKYKVLVQHQTRSIIAQLTKSIQ